MSHEAASSGPALPSAWYKLALCFAALLGFLSAWESRASVFSVLLLVIALSSSTRLSAENKSLWQKILLASLACATIGMGRFVWSEALPGIAEARGRASGKKAVSFLREILFAQDAMRRYAFIDPDGDGIGSAGLLNELSGHPTARSQTPYAAPLAARYAPRVATASGPATEVDGHLILICLPGRATAWITRPGEEVEEETAEHRWLAYAWPAREGLPHKATYFIDEHERILESDDSGSAELRWVGPDRSPPCDAAVAEPTKGYFRPWQGKTPRKLLPGAT